MTKYILILGSSAALGLNAFFAGRILPATPLLTFLLVAGMAAALASFYFTCKTWYYRGGVDALEEIKKKYESVSKE